jgi:hypothetical protein
MTNDVLDDLVFDHDVERLVDELGSRPVAEILREVGCCCLARTMIHGRVREYLARLDRAMLGATGGDRFPPSPIRLVGPTS